METIVAIGTVTLAIVTGLLFYATLAVASRTADLAADTVSGAEQADIHHQESLTPILTLVPGWVYRDPGSRIRLGPVSSYPLSQLRNMGSGPALSIMLTAEPVDPDGERRTKATVSLSPVGANESLPIDDNVGWPLTSPEGTNVSIPQQLPDDFWITLTYTNLFGATASTVHEIKRHREIVSTVYTKPNVDLRKAPTRSAKKTWLEKFLRL